MNKKRKEIIAGNAISNIYEWRLGGYDQKVLIEGKKEELPVVITLHGGPGNPVPFSVGCRGLLPEFTDHFIMVYWDQLGCGINNHVIDDTFTIESFVQMTLDLIGEVKKLFPANKIFVFSMSWGSILSAKILEKSAHIADGVVVWGQIVSNLFFNSDVMNALEHSDIPKKKLARIKAARKETASPKELQLISSSIKKYTSGYQNKKGAQAPMGEMIKGVLTSPDYKFRDFIATVINGYRKNRSLWQENLCLDLSETLRNVQIPYIILQGDTDIVTSTQAVRQLVVNSDNPNLKCIVVENSGHVPGSAGMNQALRMLNELAVTP